MEHHANVIYCTRQAYFCPRGQFTNEFFFQNNNAMVVQLDNISEAKQGPKFFSRCCPAVQACVHHAMGICNCVLHEASVTLAAVYIRSAREGQL
jgi:hypothetical protein